MKVFKGLTLTALMLVGSMSFIAPTQANIEALNEAPSQTSTQAPIEAPLTPVTYPSTLVTTSPSEAPTEAPTQPLNEGLPEGLPTAPPKTPSQAPSQPTPNTGGELPTASPSQAVQPSTAPAVDSYSGNLIVDCAAQGLVTAEDHTCVPASFYSNTPDCNNLKLGDAWAGVGTHCQLDKAPAQGQTPVRGPAGICLDVLVPKGTPGNYCYTY